LNWPLSKLRRLRLLLGACQVSVEGERVPVQVTREFERAHPCPSTGRTTGACPGFVRDHVVPLACGGPDAVSNLQWQTIRDARIKDRWERRACGR
jgi:hypothetical protein